MGEITDAYRGRRAIYCEIASYVFLPICKYFLKTFYEKNMFYVDFDERDVSTDRSVMLVVDV